MTSRSDRSTSLRYPCVSVWCISGVWIPCWAGCLLWLLGAIICIWCAPTGDLSDKLFRFTFIERFVLLQVAVRLLWLFGDVAPTLVPTFVAAWGDSPELSVVGAEGFDEVLCEAKSLPPLAPAAPPLPPVEPAEPPVTVFEHLRHFGSQEWRRTNFRYSFLTCKSEAEPTRPNETSLTVRERTKGLCETECGLCAFLRVWYMEIADRSLQTASNEQPWYASKIIVEKIIKKKNCSLFHSIRVSCQHL